MANVEGLNGISDLNVSGDTNLKGLTLNDISEENKAKANIAKEKANEHFKKQEFEKSIALYTEAIELNPLVSQYYGNRSFAYIKTECYGYALSDANQAIKLDPKYVKAYYRRATANMALGKFKLASKDFESVTKTHPNDKDAKMKYVECNKIATRLAFEKAISVEEKKKSVVEQINLDTMAVEEDYDGPRLDGETNVSLSFAHQLIETYKKQQKLHRKYAYKILLDAREYFSKQPSMVDISIEKDKKFTVCGDVHGQFYDLLNIFELNGFPSEENPYLFNGDFVDRGSFSVECIFTLLTLKLLFPNHFYMSRGNHESETMNQMYGFEGEVKSKYSGLMVKLFTEVYNFLPLCHLISNKILVMHGGLFSQDDVTLADIRKIERDRQPPDSGLMCELLWSDPQPQNGRSPSKRGVGTQFGPDITKAFLEKNSLDYIIRSHEVKQEGYEIAHDGKCITVFSAPNYCDTMGNKGAFLVLKGGDLTPKITSYSAVPHPDVKPMAYANSLLSLLS